MKRTKCPRCSYEWDPKVPRPKECPRCKQRLDSEPRHAKGTRPRVARRKDDPLPQGFYKRVRDTQKYINNLTARIIEVEKRINRIEKKLRKMGDLFE